MDRNRIILVYPGRLVVTNRKRSNSLFRRIFPAVPVRQPLSILPLAGVLKKNGFCPYILDSRVEDYRNVNFSNALFVGISTMSIGNMIHHGLRIACYIKAHYPEISVVWGGIHPTLCPEMTIQNKYVDIVVRGEGEETIVELANFFKEGGELENIKGITFIKQGQIINTPDRDFFDLNKLDMLPYHLLKFGRYKAMKKTFIYQSSRGCPHECVFCYNVVYNKQKWRARDAIKVVDDLEYIVEHFAPEQIQFFEDEFFINQKRVECICRELLRRNLNIKWTADCRLDHLARYDDEFFDLLVKSGCKILTAGAESGSDKMLTLMHKNITLEQMYKGINNMSRHNIKLQLTFISGFPEETRKDLTKTLDFIDNVREINPDTDVCSINILFPFPGSPIFEQAKQLGFKPPQSLEEWSNSEWARENYITWHTRKYRSLLKTLYILSRFIFISRHPLMKDVPWIIRVPVNILGKIGDFRWKHRLFGFPVEWRIFDTLKRMFIDYF